MASTQDPGAARRFFGPADAPARPLEGEHVAVLGYGNLGRTVALNLRDSGVTVRVGNIEDEYAPVAREDGFEVVLAEAAGDDVIAIMLPDEVIPEVFEQTIRPALKAGAAIAFGSGYNLAYDLSKPPANVDVLLVAPRMAGETARQRFQDGLGFWAYVHVEQDASGKAEQRMLGLAAGIGALKAGAVEMSAEMEALIDLYIEQTVGPLIGAAIMAAFDIGSAGGIPAEALILEMYMSGEMETAFESFRRLGLFKASDFHGPTALYGGTMRLLEFQEGREQIYKRFQEVLEDIKNGGFARRFQEERAQGYPVLAVARSYDSQNPGIVAAEQTIREHGGG